jgi:poly-gamma-glutamate synthesis protein (capsule biosynthesis protein)
VLVVTGKGRVLVYSLGSTSSGIPSEWGAAEDRPGVNLHENLSEEAAGQVAKQMRQIKRPGDVTIASIHWGGNWGYDIPDEQIQFAHRLVEEGVDIVHGHSSHHVKTIEVYQDHLILYGCGDFVTDYEGISRPDWFRSDLALMYLAKIHPQDGRLLGARLVPLQSRRFRSTRASTADAMWLGDLLNRVGTPFGTQVKLESDNSLILRWHHHKSLARRIRLHSPVRN